MGLYFGISCLRRNWNGIYLGTEFGSRSDVVGLHGEVTDPASELPEHGIFSTLEKHASLAHCKSWNDEAIVHKLHQNLDTYNLGAIFSELEFEAERPDAVGICHPYGLSPAARRALPALVDADPIQLRHRTELNGEHRDTRRDLRICAIETPFAACLTLVDRSELQLPATVVVIAEAADAFEITALKIDARSQELQMNVIHHVQIAQHETDAASLEESFHRFFGNKGKLDAPVTIVSVESNTQQIAELLSDRLHGSTARRLDEQDLAAGAARYTSMCVEQDQSSFEYRSLNCSLIVPRAIGICGRNEADKFFWCPIIEATQPMQATHLMKLSGGSQPRRLVLAEHTGPARDVDSWGTESDVEHLRWHSQVTIDSITNAEPTSLEIVIQGSTGCLEYGWSDPFVSASLARRD
jgi:hypothetical protein